MGKVRIIYTPDAGKFCLDNFQMIGTRSPGDPEVARLKANYDRLRGRFSDLGQDVGVVNFEKVFRVGYEKRSEETEEAGHHYHPLGILDKAIALEGEDTSTGIAREYVYRRMMQLIMHPAIPLDLYRDRWVDCL